MSVIESVSREEIFKYVESAIFERIDIEDLGISAISEDDALIATLGLDSVDFLEVVFDIEERYEISIPIEDWQGQAEGKEENHAVDNFVMSTFVDNIQSLVNEK
ncbi:MAG: hypothetical protein HRU25_01350 [Psychrobium sp.]|nr:hypothetical protein [Psychrobium sp.]